MGVIHCANKDTLPNLLIAAAKIPSLFRANWTLGREGLEENMSYDSKEFEFENITLESFKFSSWQSYTNIGLLILVLFSGSIALVIYGSFLRFICKYAEPNRPINELIALDQVQIYLF